MRMQKLSTSLAAAAASASQACPFGLRTWALRAKGVGAAPTAWNVALEVSPIDDFTGNETSILTHVSGTNADGATVFVADKPALFYRVRLVSVTLGLATAVKIDAVGMP